MKSTILVLLLAAAAGCSKDAPATAKTTPQPPPSKPDAPPAEDAPPVANNTQVSPSLAVSGDLASMCGIKAASSTAADPKFDYDKDELTPDDRSVLDQIATCLTTGPLKGKAVALTGRADPRGTTEYNMGLGSRRANSVSNYLGRLGVKEPQMAVSTRGALEATGTDESGWKQDRRVDITLRTN